MIFGEYNYINVDVDKLITLPQVRKIKNAKIEELVDSIRSNGLINPIDIVILDKESFINHINFINKIWKENIDYSTYPSLGEKYYVVVAGHTRLKAIKKIIKDDNIVDSKINTKVHNAKTSEEILSIQLDENIHSEPRIEERAIAIIECFYLGLSTGKWHDQKDFISQNKHKFSSNVLKDALAFTNLPLDIKTYILNGNLFYKTGVELGKLSSLIEKYTANLLGKDFTEEEFNEALRIEYAIIISKAQKLKSVKATQSFISGYKSMMEDAFKPKEDVAQTMLAWWEDGVLRQSREAINKLRKEHDKLLKDFTKERLEQQETFFDLDTELTGKNNDSNKELLLRMYNLVHKEN